MLTLIYKL